MNFAVVYGSYREERAGIRLAHYLVRHFKDRGHHVTLFDAKELDLPIINRRYFEYQADEAPEKLSMISQAFLEMDAFILICGEYNHSLQPGLTNLLNYFLHEFDRKPGAVALYSSGPLGGWRAGMHIMDFILTLGMAPVPNVLSVPRISTQLDEDGQLLQEDLHQHTEKFLDRVEWYAQALKDAREK